MIFFIADFLTHDIELGAKRNFFFIIYIYLIPCICVQFFGFIGLLTKWSVLSSLALSCLIILFLKKKPSSNFLLSIDLPKSKESFLFLSVISFLVIRSATLTVWMSHDDNTYHAAIAAQWIKYGTFFVPELSYQASYPLSGSLFPAFMMMFTGSESSASLNEIMLFLISFFSCKLLFRKTNFPLERSILVVALFFSSQDVHRYLRGFSDADISPGILILAFLTAFLRTKVKNLKESICIGVLGGIISGLKVTSAVFILPFMFFIIKKLIKFDKKFIFGIIASFFTVMSPWYLRNLLIYSNPFAPFEKFGFKGLIDSEIVKISSLSSVWETFDFEVKKDVIIGFIYWLPGAWVIPTLGLVFLCLSFRSKDQRRTSFSWELLGSLAVFFSLFIGSCYSGRYESLFPNVNSARYLMPLYFLMLIFCFGMTIKLSNLKARYLLFVGCLLFLIGLQSGNEKRVFLSLLGAISIFLFYWRKEMIKVPSLIIIVFVILGADLWGKKGLVRSKEKSYWFLPVLNDMHSEGKVAFYDDEMFVAFMLMGEGFKKTPVRLDSKGRKIDLRTNLNIEKKLFYPTLKPTENSLNCQVFSKNLRANKIDILVVGKNLQGKLPRQACLKGLDNFKMVFTNKSGVIYKSIN